MKQKNQLKLRSGALLIFVLTVGVFGIIDTEMGVIGILPLIAETFHASRGEAVLWRTARCSEEKGNVVFHCCRDID